MSSDLKIAFGVLHDISSKDLEQYLDTLKNDAAKAQTEVETLRNELQNLVPPLQQQIADLLKKIDESLSRLTLMRANKDRTSPECLVSRKLYPDFQELKLSVVATQLDVMKLWGVLESESVNILVHQESPLFFAFGLGKLTPDERRGFMVRLFRDMLGFVPVVDKGASVWSLIDTLKEWTKHKAKLSESISRVGYLIGVAELVRYMREEGIVSIRKLVEERQSQFQKLPETIKDYEAMHNKLVLDTEWLVEELRKPKLQQSERRESQ